MKDKKAGIQISKDTKIALFAILIVVIHLISVGLVGYRFYVQNRYPKWANLTINGVDVTPGNTNKDAWEETGLKLEHVRDYIVEIHSPDIHVLGDLGVFRCDEETNITRIVALKYDDSIKNSCDMRIDNRLSLTMSNIILSNAGLELNIPEYPLSIYSSTIS